MNYREAFELQKGEVISLVGGGGKTSLLYALSKELGVESTVVTTTTTKILTPSPLNSAIVILEQNQATLLDKLFCALKSHNHVTLATRKTEEKDKLEGVNPEFINTLKITEQIDFIIIEADGAKGRSLKFPKPKEPVVPSSTSLLIPVVGIDVVGKPFNNDTVFRAAEAQEVTRYKIGDPITLELIVDLIAHPLGICKGAPKNARIIPFINKVESSEALKQAGELAALLRRNNHFPIDSVVLGSIHDRCLRRNS